MIHDENKISQFLQLTHIIIFYFIFLLSAIRLLLLLLVFFLEIIQICF